MSALCAPPGQRSRVDKAAHACPSPPELRFTKTDNFADLLQKLGASLLVSTYQANRLLVVRAYEHELSVLVRTFDKPMGLAADRDRLAMGTRCKIWLLRQAAEIVPRLRSALPYDACYLPRSCHVTGDIRVHEIGWAGDELWIVNTLFSCLCTLHPEYSFVPRWRPPFVTTLASEDRCHLNGMALDPRAGGKAGPRYVTALGATDARNGWRPDKARGGCVIDVPSGEMVARGLSMPHSPRLHNGRLWLLESGTGRLLLVDPDTGRWESVAELPGYVRGLALSGRYAFVGLSKFRETSTFGGLPLAERLKAPQCGVVVIDLRSGKVIASLEFHTVVEEIFDVQLLPGVLFPEVVGFQKKSVQTTFTMPSSSKTGAGIAARKSVGNVHRSHSSSAARPRVRGRRKPKRPTGES